MRRSLRSTAVAIALAMCLAPFAAFAQHSEQAMLGRWSGTFRSTQQTQSSLAGGGIIGTINGEVTLQPTNEGGIDLYAVTIRISMNYQQESLEWGVSMGRCGSKLIMLETTGTVPTIDSRSGGDGELHHTMRLDLDAKHTYQLVLFRNGHLQQNVVACANLKYDDKMR
jgi:hypothetical protein